MASVWYVGTSNARVLGGPDWSRLGLTDVVVSEFRWDDSNGYSLPAKQFSPQQLSYLNGDPDFYINAPDSTARTMPDGPGLNPGWVDVTPTDGGVNIIGPGVTSAPAPELASGRVYYVSTPRIYPIRDPSVPSGYTYMIEEA